MWVRRGGASIIELQSTQLPLGNPHLATWLYSPTDANATQNFMEQRLWGALKLN